VNREPARRVLDGGLQLGRDREITGAGQIERGRDGVAGAAFRSANPVGVHHQSLPDGDQRKAQRRRPKGLFGCPDLSGGDQWDTSIDMLDEPFDRRAAVGGTERLVLEQVGQRGMDIIHPDIDEPIDEDDALFDTQATVTVLLRRYPTAEDERAVRLVRDDALHFGNDGEREAHPIFEQPTPRIDPPVGPGRQKVLDQEPMCTMQFDAVEPGGNCTPGRHGEIRDDGFNLTVGKCSHRGAARHKGFGAHLSGTGADDVRSRSGPSWQRMIAGLQRSPLLLLKNINRSLSF
jgi:hypothetical protein